MGKWVRNKDKFIKSQINLSHFAVLNPHSVPGHVSDCYTLESATVLHLSTIKGKLEFIIFLNRSAKVSLSKDEPIAIIFWMFDIVS